MRDAESEFARATHKGESRQMLVVVIAINNIGPVGRWPDALALVIADRLRLRVGGPCQFASKNRLILSGSEGSGGDFSMTRFGSK